MVIILYILILVLILCLIFLLSPIYVIVQKNERQNEIKIEYLGFIFFLDITYLKQRIQGIGFEQKMSIKENLLKIKNGLILKPVFQSILRKTTLEEARIIQYITIEEFLYRRKSLTSLSFGVAFLYTFLEENLKRVKSKEYSILVTKKSLAQNIYFRFRIRPLMIVFSVIENRKDVFKYLKKERMLRGS